MSDPIDLDVWEKEARSDWTSGPLARARLVALISEVRGLREQNRVMREALEFYAKGPSWWIYRKGHENEDLGARAGEALAEVAKMEGK